MNNLKIKYTVHAHERMFSRNINQSAIEKLIYLNIDKFDSYDGKVKLFLSKNKQLDLLWDCEVTTAQISQLKDLRVIANYSINVRTFEMKINVITVYENNYEIRPESNFLGRMEVFNLDCLNNSTDLNGSNIGFEADFSTISTTQLSRINSIGKMIPLHTKEVQNQ